MIATQKVGDKRVIEDYVRTMQLRGWIGEAEKLGGPVIPVMRSAISEAVGVELQEETLQEMAAGWKR